MKRSNQLQKNDNVFSLDSQLPTLSSEPLVFLPDRFFEEIPESKSIWYESEEEIKAKLEWAKEKAKLLEWVQKQIERNLTKKEKAYIEQYFFSGLTLEEISQKFKVNPSSVSRGIKRAINKLKSLKENKSITLPRKKMRRVNNTNSRKINA